MKKLLSVFVLLLSFSVFSCKNGHAPEEAVHEHHMDQHMGDSSMQTLKMDNGHKWQADISTDKSFKQMQDDVHRFAASVSDTTGTASYLQLAESLGAQMNYIFGHCTMQGAAHEELHKLLAQLGDNISEMKNGNLPEQKQAFQNTQRLLASYNQYFEL